MTTYTDNVRIPYLDQNVAQPEIPENTAKQIIDLMIAGQHQQNFVSDLDFSFTHTDSPTAATTWQNGLIEMTDTGSVLTTSRNVLLPNNKRTYIFKNSTSHALTFKVSGQPGVTLASSANMFCICNGTDIEKLEFAASGAGSSFSSLSDTPNTYTGHADKILAVNNAENAVEFIDTVSFTDQVNTFTTYSIFPTDTQLHQTSGGTGVFSFWNADGVKVCGIGLSDDADSTINMHIHNFENGGTINFNQYNGTGYDILTWDSNGLHSGTDYYFTDVPDTADKSYVRDYNTGTWSWQSNDFVTLNDAPTSYTGHGDKVLAVNTGETAVEFISTLSSITINTLTATNTTLTDYGETSHSLGSISTTATLDLSNGNVFIATVTGSVTLTFTTTHTNTSFSFLVTNAGTNIIWPATVKWEGGSEPTNLSTAGTDLLVFTKIGSNWYGAVSIIDAS